VKQEMKMNSNTGKPLEDRLRALEARLCYLEDQEQIRECLARYGYAADLGRSTEWLDLCHKSIENRCLHTVSNLLIRIEGDDAWAEGYSVVMVRSDDGQHTAATCGYNHWTFQRLHGRWHLRLRHRRGIGGNEWGGNVIKDYQQDAR
jgi:hypothetical protein